MKDKYVYLLDNKKSRDSFLHYLCRIFLLFPGNSLLLKIHIKGYPSMGRTMANGSEGVSQDTVTPVTLSTKTSLKAVAHEPIGYKDL